jgi:NADP-dependent 3-hydroxy acid dehydrogenase YdfG
MPKIVLVTGANQGLGYAFVKGLCSNLSIGSTIYLTARSEDKGNDAKAEIGNVAPVLRVEQPDVTDDQSVASIAG